MKNKVPIFSINQIFGPLASLTLLKPPEEEMTENEFRELCRNIISKRLKNLEQKQKGKELVEELRKILVNEYGFSIVTVRNTYTIDENWKPKF